MSKLPVITAAAVFALSGAARADTSRVAVAPFSGPELVAREARAVVVDVVGARYRLVPPAELDRMRGLTKTDGTESGEALTIARLAGADAVVVGRVASSGEAYALSLSVLRAASGESVGAVLVPLTAAEMTPAARDRIEHLLGSLLSWIDPGSGPPGENRSGSPLAPDALDQDPTDNPLAPDRPGPGSIDSTPAAPPAPDAPGPASGPTASAQIRATPNGQAATGEAAPTVDTKVESKAPARRFPIRFEGAAGLTATARRLGFSQQTGLVDSSLSANPSPGLRFDVEASTRGEPGIALAASYERSMGAHVALGGAERLQLPVGQKQWGFDLRGRMRLRKRWVPMASVGYSELSYQIDQRPTGLLIPDARYAFIGVGGGVRYEVGALAAYGFARYLRTMATAGITDPTSYGAAGSYGLSGEGGVEVELTDAILLRAGLRYQRFVFQFTGEGDLAVALDDDLDQDVVGASDAYVGGHAQAVYRF
jgi:hypothetical protein